MSKFSHIEEIQKIGEKFCEFSSCPVAKCTTAHFCGFTKYFVHVFIKTKMATKFWGDILCLQDARKHIFAHSPLSKQHLALTMATAMCLCQSAASPKHKKCQGHCTFLSSLPQWVGNSRCLSMGKCSYPIRKKDISLRATAQIPHEILTRELIGIYKVKFAAK